MLYYYQRFNQSRLQQISQYQATLEELAYSEQQQAIAVVRNRPVFISKFATMADPRIRLTGLYLGTSITWFQ